MNITQKLIALIDPKTLPKHNESLLDINTVSIVSDASFDASNFFSPFRSHNQILKFNGRFSVFNGSEFTCKFESILDSLLVEKRVGPANFNFEKLDALSASKSEHRWLDSPSTCWKNMEDFGYFAYWNHLPSQHCTACGTGSLDSDEKIKVHNDRLKQILDQAIEKNRRFSSVTHHEWCDKYTLNNSGRSRRYAAISHLAKNGNLDFNLDVPVELNVESIDENALKRLEEIADNYIFFSSKKYFNKLKKIIPSNEYPIGYFQSKWTNSENSENCIFLVSLIKPGEINVLFGNHYTSYDAAKYKDTYLKAYSRLKPQLDTLVKAGSVQKINEFVGKWTV